MLILVRPTARAVPLALALLALLPSLARTSDDVLPLAGTWRFELDRDDEGIAAGWERRELEHSIRLPGALQAQGYGDDVTPETKWTGEIVDQSYFTSPRYAKYREPGNVKVPFWLQPDKVYVGAAWYQRDVEVPPSWQGRRVVLHLERPHWQTVVWLDNHIVSSNDSLSTPHQHDLGNVAPGKHRLTVRVDNRLVVDVGPNSHSVTDHTQGNWNGIVGRVELRATDPVWIDDLQAYPNVATKSVTVKGRIGCATGAPGRGTLRLTAEPYNATSLPAAAAMDVPVAWEAQGGSFEASLTLGPDARTWDEFAPALYRVTAKLGTAGDERTTSFGLREVATAGTQFVVNGRKAFVRGTLECAIFPRTGHPPTDVESWKRIVRIAKAHGLNDIRFHSWCPPEAAFVAADELGFYLQVEVASWANTTARVGVGLPIDAWLYRESDRILEAYGNHPSFLLMPYGNEPAGRDREYLGRWVSHYKTKDPRRLYTSASGWPQIPENQFHVWPDPRIQAWGAGLKSRVNSLAPETTTDYREFIRSRAVPVISHEIGQWCVYPNLDETAKYDGPLKARNFEIFRDTLVANGMGGQARDFLHASGKLQTLLYKEEIESALRTPGMGGFQLLDLHDFPGQGTALVGVLDPFWDSKGYVTAAEFSRFCGPTVPLARLAKRVFTTDETLTAEVEVAHFGPAPLPQAKATWRLVGEDGRAVARGSFAAQDIPVDNGTALGRLSAPLAGLAAPRRYRLVVSLDGARIENDWDVWVYPPRVALDSPAGVTVATSLDEALPALRKGGRVLLLIPPSRVRGDDQGPVALGFSSIFWNTAWTKRQAPHTLGVLCDPKHPALARFATEGHSNWQWWYLVSRAGAMILDGLPAQLVPTIQVIDDWFTNRRLGLAFEARVEGGRLLVCSIDLGSNLDANPVARQLRHSLLYYVASARFQPQVALAAEQLRGLVADRP
jgi:hypothetical protein